MGQQESTTAFERGNPAFFRVPVFPEQLAAIHEQRRRGNRRSVAQWFDEGLQLALQGEKHEDQQLALTSGHVREVKLFCALVALGPNNLFGIWHWIWRRVRDDEGYWIFPSYCDEDELSTQYQEPYLDKQSLCDDWPALLKMAESCVAIGLDAPG
jgi:hypothetical protein